MTYMHVPVSSGSYTSPVYLLLKTQKKSKIYHLLLFFIIISDFGEHLGQIGFTVGIALFINHFPY